MDEIRKNLWEVLQSFWEHEGLITALTGSGEIIFNVLVIIALSYFVLRLRQKVIKRIFSLTKLDRKKEQTLSSVLMSLTRYVIYTVAILMILMAFDVQLGPVLAGAGIAGLAVGFGAQNLIKDIITGFFIMFEDQFHVGDYVEINGQFAGTVEELGLRMTAIREWGGQLNYISNSQIVRIKNFNRQHMRTITSITVPYEQDYEEVEQAIHNVCQIMIQSHREHFIEQDGKMIEPPQLYGITDLENGALGAKYTITALVKDESYWIVSKEIRRLLLQELKGKNIHISYPRRIYSQYAPLDDNHHS